MNRRTEPQPRFVLLLLKNFIGYLSIVLLVLIFTTIAHVYSQQSEKVVVLEHADSLIGKVLEGEDVRELIGHVRFRQGTVTVHCDRAIQYLQSRKVSLVGNVVVSDDTITMKGKRGMYYNTDRIAEAFDGVQLNDGATTLTADYGRYYVDEKKAFFRNNVYVWDSVSTLKADELTYHRDGKPLPVRQAGASPDKSGGGKRSIAVGNVQIHNIEDNITIFGGHFENYNEQKFSRMTNQPRVIQIDTSEGKIDTFTVYSRVMESYRDSLKRLVAIDSVRLASSELAGESGFAVYLTDLDSIIMRKKPFIWYEDSQVSGDSIFIKLNKRKPQEVYVRGDAFAISQSDSLFPKRLNQVTGEHITMHFDDGRIQRIEVDRTATSVYFLYEDPPAVIDPERRAGQKDTLGIIRRPNGINKTTGDHVVIYFANGKADRISVVGGVEGEYFPENMVEGREADYYLPGFNWREDRPWTHRKPRKVSADKTITYQ